MLNRERTNIGRTAYDDHVKAILLQCDSKAVSTAIVEELKEFSTCEQKNELRRLDVQEYEIRILNMNDNIAFITTSEFQNMSEDQRYILNHSGREFVTIADNLASKLETIQYVSGRNIVTPSSVFKEYTDSFQYEFINISKLTSAERNRYTRLT